MADESLRTAANKKPVCSFFKKSNRKKNVRKRKAESSSSDDDETSVIRKERKAAHNPFIQKSEGLKLKTAREDLEVDFKSTRSAMRAGPEDLGATATYELDTERDKDAQAIFEKKLKVNKELKEREGDDKVYRGLNNYMTFYEKRDTAQGNAASGMVRYFVNLENINVLCK